MYICTWRSKSFKKYNVHVCCTPLRLHVQDCKFKTIDTTNVAMVYKVSVCVCVWGGGEPPLSLSDDVNITFFNCAVLYFILLGTE